MATRERPPSDGVGLHVDLKWHGYETTAAEAIRRHGLVERTVVSSVHASSLRELAALEPSLQRGFTYPYDRRGFSRRRPLVPVTTAGLFAIRRTLPLRIGHMLDRARASATMLHHLVVSRAAVERAHAPAPPSLPGRSTTTSPCDESWLPGSTA